MMTDHACSKKDDDNSQGDQNAAYV